MQAGKSTVRLGVLTLLLSVLVALWELWARQAPGSPAYLGVLAEPIGALRSLAFALGLVVVLAGLLCPWAYPAGVPRALSLVLYLGAMLALGAQLYGASHGMLGVQAYDPRPDAWPLFVTKFVGLALVLAFLLETARRVLMRPPPGT